MVKTDAVIVGAGQAGLAMSYCLRERGIDHVVLDRGQVGERWRSERWDSLRLLTPNWQTRLPGFAYDGDRPDGYMSAPEVAAFLERYARSFAAPVHPRVQVRALRPCGEGFIVTTYAGKWLTRTAIVATGYCDTPFVPKAARSLPRDVMQVVPSAYRRPSDLPPGGVLVVGASATGIQLADEIHASGRPVVLAAGQHLRMPRRYRGRDVLYWLDVMGTLREQADNVYDVAISRSQPSLQLVGRDDYASLDLPALKNRGVTITGHFQGARGRRLFFDNDLVKTTAASDAKLAMLLQRIDRYIDDSGQQAQAAVPFVPSWPRFVQALPDIDYRSAAIATVIWATGFKRSYSWLKAPVLDALGEIRHDGGVTPLAGLYTIGLHFLRRRNSSFIDGVGDDARELADHLASHLRRSRAA